jgi:hypothetical protein
MIQVIKIDSTKPISQLCRDLLAELEFIAPRGEWIKEFIKAYGVKPSYSIKYEGGKDEDGQH